MQRSSWRTASAALLALVVSSTVQAQQALTASGSAMLTPAQQSKADGGVPPFTAADVHFMQGMIGHHAQAIVMAAWAPGHGARPDVATLCARIIVSQSDEINSMGRWLR